MSSVLYYEGMIQETKQWGLIDTYGGKLTENIVQAISRDLLGESMLNMWDSGFEITMHVHDEVISEVPKEHENEYLHEMLRIMSITPAWAEGLPLKGAGFVAPYYQKD